MKRMILFCIIISFIGFSIIGCRNNSQNDNPLNMSARNESEGEADNSFCNNIPAAYFSAGMTVDTWNSANMENSVLKNREDFLAEAEYYIKVISEFLSKENWFEVYKDKHGDDYICNIVYRLTEGASHVEEGYLAYIYLIPNVYLNKDLIEHDLAPIAHETTHIIAPFYSSLSLREGLACYCQDKFGKNPSVFNYGIDAHAYTNMLLIDKKEEFEKIFAVIGTADSLQNSYATGDSRSIFYILSYSFSKYLIDNYGITNFLKLYESEDLISDYTDVCGKPFDEVKIEWYKSIEFYAEPMTSEEIEIYMLELLKEHKFTND